MKIIILLELRQILEVNVQHSIHVYIRVTTFVELLETIFNHPVKGDE